MADFSNMEKAESGYKRIMKEIMDSQKAFCLLCESRTKVYTGEGLKQHCKSAHPGEDFSFEVFCEDLSRLCVQECKDMLECLSSLNKVLQFLSRYSCFASSKSNLRVSTHAYELLIVGLHVYRM